MRVSDADRHRTLEELARHCRAGRLDVDEYSERVEKALVASDLGELDSSCADLPMMRIADPSSPPTTGQRSLRVWTARLVVVLSVLLLAAAVVLAVAAQWIWTVLLVVGWVLGVLQGRVQIRR